MSNTVDTYPPATLPLDGSELFPVEQGTHLKKISVAAVLALAKAAAGTDANVIAVATDLLGANKIGAVASGLDDIDAVADDLALGAASLIKQAPQAAIDAAAAAARAEAAGVTASYISGSGPPGVNVGVSGDIYDDVTSMVRYGPKGASGWPQGIAITQAAVPSRVRYDMRYGGAFPTALWTFTRSTASSDFMYWDAPSYGPGNTFAINAPVVRADIGYGHFMQAQQFLANPGAPATQTTASVAVGVVVLIGWGPAGSTITATAGTAVGTGFGVPLDCAAGGFQAITITTAGTITVTVSGAVQFFNLQQNPTLPAITEPVPYIGSQTTRAPDNAVATSAMLAKFNSGAGTLIFQTTHISNRSYGRSPSMLGLNGTSALYAASATQVTAYDVANHNTSELIGSTASWQSETRSALAWSGAANITFGAGVHFEKQHPFAFNNGVTVTSATLGASSSSSYGAQSLNGFIEWFEIGTTRLTDENLYQAYTALASPTIDALLKDYTGVGQFRKFIAACELMQAGAVDSVKVAVIGPSHEVGTGTGSNVRANGWMPQLVSLLEADGIPATDDSFCGINGTAWGAGTNSHDSRLTFTGSTPTLGGLQFGGEVIIIPSGTVLTFAPARQTARASLRIYTAASGYGSAEVSIDGGTTAIVPVGGGSATISSTAAVSILTKDFLATLGANSWSIKAVGGPVHLCMFDAYNPAAKQLRFFNGGRSGYTISSIAQDAGFESSYAAPIRNEAFPLVIGSVDMTNDMATPTAWASYGANGALIIANIKLNGDFLMLTDPPSSTASFAQTNQNIIWRQALAVAMTGAVPVYDFFAWNAGIYATSFAAGYFGSDTLHLSQRGQKEAKSKPLKVFIERLIGFAG